jgi:hypothetical protein
MVRLTISEYLSFIRYKKSRIVIYSEVIQLFEIIQYQATEENDTDVVCTLACKDNNGDDCTLP